MFLKGGGRGRHHALRGGGGRNHVLEGGWGKEVGRAGRGANTIGPDPHTSRFPHLKHPDPVLGVNRLEPLHEVSCNSSKGVSGLAAATKGCRVCKLQ